MEITLLKSEISFLSRLVQYFWERPVLSWYIFIFCLWAVVLMLSEQCHFYFFVQYAILIGFLHSCVPFIWFGGVVKKNNPSWERIFNLML